MAYKKMVDLNPDTVYKLGGVDGKTGKPNKINLEGYYLGVKVVTTKDGTATIHVLQTPKGNEGFWGSADTNSKLAKIYPGTKVNVVFVGKIKIGGGKTKNKFDVNFDTSDTIEVDVVSNEKLEKMEEAITEFSKEAPEYNSDYSALSEEDDLENIEDDEDEEQNTALRLAEQKAAKTRELLGKSKKLS